MNVKNVPSSNPFLLILEVSQAQGHEGSVAIVSILTEPFIHVLGETEVF